MDQPKNQSDESLAGLPPRDRILRTASALFHRRSIHTVGIDRIIAESGVAKMTFYKHFPSKAQLISTYLQGQTDAWLGMLMTATDRMGLQPVDRVLAIFDALEGPFLNHPFRGCPFVKGLSEFGPDTDAPEIQIMIDSYFSRLNDLVTDLLKPLGLRDPDMAGRQILALIQGSIVMAQATSDPGIAAACRNAAKTLLKSEAVV